MSIISRSLRPVCLPLTYINEKKTTTVCLGLFTHAIWPGLIIMWPSMVKTYVSIYQGRTVCYIP